MEITEELRRRIVSDANRRAALLSWGRCADREKRTRPGREAFERSFYDKARAAMPDATEEQIEKAAKALRRAHYEAIWQKSRQVRLARKAQRAAEGGE